MTCEVRRNTDGTLDEVVSDGCTVHLEQMEEGHWWLALKMADGRILHINLESKRPIEASVEWEQP